MTQRSSTPPTTIRLRGTADVLAVLPYHLGYHPRDSVVAVVLHGSRFGMVARLDLPPATHLLEAAQAVVRAVGQQDADSVLLVGYESRRGASTALLSCLRDLLEDEAIPVPRTLVVRGDRWHQWDDSEDGGPEVIGEPLPVPAEVPAVADFVALGRSPHADRSDLLTPLLPDDEGLVAAVAGCLSTWRGRALGVAGPLVDDAMDVWAQVMTDGVVPAPADVALMARSLRDLQVRDALIALLCPGTLPPEALDPEVVGLLHDCLPEPAWSDPITGGATGERGGELDLMLQSLAAVCRCLPVAESAPMLTVLANLLWWRGDGSRARVALDRALDCEGDYRLAQLLSRMVDLAIRPPGARFGGSSSRTRSA